MQKLNEIKAECKDTGAPDAIFDKLLDRYERKHIGNGVFVVFMGSKPWVWITDPKVMHDVMVKNNQFITKEPVIEMAFYQLIGKNLAFSHTDATY